MYNYYMLYKQFCEKVSMCRRGMVQLNNALGLDCVIETLAHMDSTSTVSCWGEEFHVITAEGSLAKWVHLSLTQAHMQCMCVYIGMVTAHVYMWPQCICMHRLVTP